MAGCVLFNVTSASPVAGKGDEGIGPLKVSVPVIRLPPLTLFELSVNDVSLGPGVRSASFRETFCAPGASIVASKEKGTALVTIGNVAVFAPSGTVTEDGTLAY